MGKHNDEFRRLQATNPFLGSRYLRQHEGAILAEGETERTAQRELSALPDAQRDLVQQLAGDDPGAVVAKARQVRAAAALPSAETVQRQDAALANWRATHAANPFAGAAMRRANEADITAAQAREAEAASTPTDEPPPEAA